MEYGLFAFVFTWFESAGWRWLAHYDRREVGASVGLLIFIFLFFTYLFQ
jgi:hypothetical protein